MRQKHKTDASVRWSFESIFALGSLSEHQSIDYPEYTCLGFASLLDLDEPETGQYSPPSLARNLLLKLRHEVELDAFRFFVFLFSRKLDMCRAVLYRFLLFVFLMSSCFAVGGSDPTVKKVPTSVQASAARGSGRLFLEKFFGKQAFSKRLSLLQGEIIPGALASAIKSRTSESFGIAERGGSLQRRVHNRTLPLFLFIAGVEGSGHHALGIALERCFDVSFSFAPDVWVAQYYSLTPYPWANATEFHQRLLSNSYGASVIGAEAVLDYQHSFPFGWYRSTLFHPDLNVLNDLDGEYFDLRVIFLHRDPAETVSSALSRGFVKDPFLQARIVEAALMYMDRFLEVMPPEKAVVIHYDKYRKQPLDYLDTLSRFSGHCTKEDLRDFMIEADLIMNRFRQQRPRNVGEHLCPRDVRRRPEECDAFEARIRAWFAARSKYWPRLAQERLL